MKQDKKREEKITPEEKEELQNNKKEVNILFWLDFSRTVSVLIMCIILIYSPCFTIAKGNRSMFTNVVDFFMKKPDNFNDNLWFYMIYTLLVLFQFALAGYAVYQMVNALFSFKDQSEFYHRIRKGEQEKVGMEQLSYASIICFLVYVLFHYLLNKKNISSPINLFLLLPVCFILITVSLNIYQRNRKSKFVKSLKK